MTYEEAINIAVKNPSESFTGLNFHDNYFGFYTISPDQEEPGRVNIFFEGGYLFASEGEEECYEIDDVPKEVESLYFKNSKNLPDISGLAAEYALYELFPALQDPESIWSKQERLSFIKSAKEHIGNTWCRD